MHRNNINLLRLLAACQVVVSHLIGHFDLAPSDSPIVVAIRMFPGVPIFFLLSGHLIYRAWECDPNIWYYLANRGLRIFPALWAAFAVTLVVLFLADQFDGTARQTGVWIIAQLTIFQFYNPEFLRDFGVGVVNGALWSIPVEIQFYFVLPVCAVLFRRWPVALVTVLLAAAINVALFQGFAGFLGVSFVVACTATAATLSWLLIERTALALKRHTNMPSGKNSPQGTVTEPQ